VYSNSTASYNTF